MSVPEAHLANATLRAMTDLMEVLQQSISHNAARVDGVRNEPVHLAPHDQAIEIVGPALAGIVDEAISTETQ